MKTIPIMTFFLCTAMYAQAQLNIVPKSDGLKRVHGDKCPSL